MSSYPDGVDPGQFLPTTQVYDLEEKKESLEDFTVRIRNNLNAIVLSLNARDSGYYSLEETVNGQLFFPDYTKVNPATGIPATYRQVYRTVVNFGQLPNVPPGSKSVPHGINVTSDVTFTRIYGTATRSDIGVGLPLPLTHTAALNQCILLYVTATNVIINVGIDRTVFDRCYVVVEYLKS